MTATQIPTRMLVVLGIALAALAAFLVARPMLLESSGSSSDATSSTTPSAPLTPTTPKSEPAATPTTTKLVLLPGLPTKVASRLQHSRVVVVSVYAGTDAGDRSAVGAARRGAKEAGTGFAALNILDEKTARQAQPFLGSTATPVVLVIRRPGKVVARFVGPVDQTVVAQAATNARGPRASK